MAIALVEHFNPDALTMLTTAKVKHDATAWNFAHPLLDSGKVTTTANIDALRSVDIDPATGKQKDNGGFAAAEKLVLEALPSQASASKGQLIIGVQAGMGIGKSHAIDVADQLFFVGRNPLVLKVTYNKNQTLHNDKLSPTNSFFARVVLALHRNVPPDSDSLVRDVVVARQHTTELAAQAIAKFLLENTARGQPIIIAVDEIGMLENVAVIREVLSAISLLIREVYSLSDKRKKREIIGLVTALPNVDIKSFSKRQPIVVSPVSLGRAAATKLLKKFAPSIKRAAVAEILCFCGGHPRSLAVAAQLYTNDHTRAVPHPKTVADGCMWKISQGSNAKALVSAISDAYRMGDETLEGKMATLHSNAMVMEIDDRYAIAPTVLWSCAKVNDSLVDVRSMFKVDGELTNYHWECFRRRNGHSVIPPRMAPSKPTTASRFCFDVTNVDTSSILKKKKGVTDGFSIDESKYYFPAASNHRAFESMCVAKSTKGKKRKTLCLFQSKINNKLTLAIEGLNKAAKDLKEIWDGDFLFVIFALESKKDADTSAAKHPVLLVTEETLDDYFTATLAPAAKLCLLRHKRHRRKYRKNF